MATLKPTVFVVDPDPTMRAALKVMIGRAGWTADTFASPGDFFARRPPLNPCCLILEIDLPDFDGLELLRRIAGDRKEIPVIVISRQGDIPRAVQIMKAGAVDYLLKPLAEESLVKAIGNALAWSRVVLHQDATLLELRRRHQSLSSREREVMARVVAGLLNKQVGAVLGISEITVKAHRGRVMRKMGADSLAGLVGMALTLRLPPAPAIRIHPSGGSRAAGDQFRPTPRSNGFAPDSLLSSDQLEVGAVLHDVA